MAFFVLKCTATFCKNWIVTLGFKNIDHNMATPKSLFCWGYCEYS
jgi:hypothetical protein